MALCLSSSYECAVLTLEKILDIVVKFNSGKSQRCVSTIAKISKTTIANILKQHEKIQCHMYMSLSDCPALAKNRVASSGKVSLRN